MLILRDDVLSCNWRKTKNGALYFVNWGRINEKSVLCQPKNFIFNKMAAHKRTNINLQQEENVRVFY
jgi:hypothetical protein